jgi:hypothetical protein
MSYVFFVKNRTGGFTAVGALQAFDLFECLLVKIMKQIIEFSGRLSLQSG